MTFVLVYCMEARTGCEADERELWSSTASPGRWHRVCGSHTEAWGQEGLGEESTCTTYCTLGETELHLITIHWPLSLCIFLWHLCELLMMMSVANEPWLMKQQPESLSTPSESWVLCVMVLWTLWNVFALFVTSCWDPAQRSPFGQAGWKWTIGASCSFHRRWVSRNKWESGEIWGLLNTPQRKEGGVFLPLSL